jgi:hypothetical protein
MSKKKKEINLNTILETDQDNVEERDELSQEAINIFKALDEYVEKHNGDVFYHMSFGAFDESGDVVDCRYDTYGYDDVVIISMEDMLNDLKKQKETEDKQ